nr:MAG TPA: hypothetical protein [Bacteriophage sp.]
MVSTKIFVSLRYRKANKIITIIKIIRKWKSRQQ